MATMAMQILWNVEPEWKRKIWSHTWRHTLEADDEGLDPTIKSVVVKHTCRREEGRHHDQDENMAAQAAFENFKTLGLHLQSGGAHARQLGGLDGELRTKPGAERFEDLLKQRCTMEAENFL